MKVNNISSNKILNKVKRNKVNYKIWVIEIEQPSLRKAENEIKE